ncbi:hypothetical protein INT47_005343 [Mucor saturninus]|uniref:Uncharacterized protein n=1 Tax=Mucor saturninus TaxID=64648 RepID=A0A8H7QI36_9FUNG|nr:hypothetical protein INT47_005343 [Mucor saturninus]
MTRNRAQKPAAIMPMAQTSNATPTPIVTTKVKKQVIVAWKFKDGGNDKMTDIGRLVHFLMKDGALMLFAYLGSDNNGESVSGNTRDQAASKACQYFDGVGAPKRTKFQMLDCLSKLLTKQYRAGYSMWKQIGEAVTDENPSFEGVVVYRYVMRA